MRQLESFTFYTEVEEEDGELMTFTDSWFDEEQQFYETKESFVHFIRYYDIHNIKCVNTIVTHKIMCFEDVEEELTEYEMERLLNDVEPSIRYQRDMEYVLKLSKTYQ